MCNLYCSHVVTEVCSYPGEIQRLGAATKSSPFPPYVMIKASSESFLKPQAMPESSVGKQRKDLSRIGPPRATTRLHYGVHSAALPLSHLPPRPCSKVYWPAYRLADVNVSAALDVTF